MGMVGSYMQLSEEELTRVLQDSGQIEEWLEDEERQADIDKAWHGLYFLLTGEADLNTIERHSLGKTIFGTAVIDEESGLAYLKSDEVADLSQRLQYIDLSALEARYDADSMNRYELYPFERDWGMEEKEYLLEQFEELKQIFHRATQRKQALVTWIS